MNEEEIVDNISEALELLEVIAMNPEAARQLEVLGYGEGIDADASLAITDYNALLAEHAEQQATITELVEALRWTGGSPDFNEGGQAEQGWDKVCRPALARVEGRLK